MFLNRYKIQMPTGILIFELDLLVTELLDGVAVDAVSLKKALSDWWLDESAPRRTPEEACLGAWATATDHFVNTKQHPRVQCVRVSVETSGQSASFTPTDDTWRQLDE